VKAFIRTDIVSRGELIPHSLGGYVSERYNLTLFDYEQPEELDGKEFNAIITAPDGARFYVMSIDLEFPDETSTD